MCHSWLTDPNLSLRHNYQIVCVHTQKAGDYATPGSCRWHASLLYGGSVLLAKLPACIASFLQWL